MLDIIFGRLFGVFGIYLATLIARLCTNLWYEPYAVYRYGLKKNPMIYWAKYARNLLLLVFAGGICGILCSLCNFSVVANVALKLIICTIVPNAVFVLAFYRTEEFAYLKSTANNILSILSRK